jgi:hypothetical protein
MEREANREACLEARVTTLERQLTHIETLRQVLRMVTEQVLQLQARVDALEGKEDEMHEVARRLCGR